VGCVKLKGMVTLIKKNKRGYVPYQKGPMIAFLLFMMFNVNLPCYLGSDSTAVTVSLDDPFLCINDCSIS
jgi:hypothetical protein